MDLYVATISTSRDNGNVRSRTKSLLFSEDLENDDGVSDFSHRRPLIGKFGNYSCVQVKKNTLMSQEVPTQEYFILIEFADVLTF